MNEGEKENVEARNGARLVEGLLCTQEVWCLIPTIALRRVLLVHAVNLVFRRQRWKDQKFKVSSTTQQVGGQHGKHEILTLKQKHFIFILLSGIQHQLQRGAASSNRK